MARFVRPFRCEILTPSGRSESLEAVNAVFPATDGMVGVLGGRAPLAAVIGSGALAVETTSGAHREYYVSGGFARMDENVLTILAEECTPVAELDPEAAWDEIQAASDMPQETEAQVARRDEALYAARAKFGLIQKYRKEQGGAQAIAEDMD